MKRIYSCMNGHVPRFEFIPNTERVTLVCARPECGVATHQHKTSDDAIKEWNNAGSRMWNNYELAWWQPAWFIWLLRWWHGCFYE